MLSSIEATYSLAVGVCGHDHVFVKEVRDFPHLSTHATSSSIRRSKLYYSITTNVTRNVLRLALNTELLPLLAIAIIATDLFPSPLRIS